jgi:XRE family transcriptional regulator of biofilm formation
MIGKNIYKLRKERGLTLSELAEKANVAKSYLSNIERNINQNPSILIIDKIAQVLNVEVKALITGGYHTKQTLEKEWIDLIEEIKKSGMKREDLQEYRTLFEFIKWRNNQQEEPNISNLEEKNE